MGERILYIKDFMVKHSQKRKLPNELPVDRKRTEALFCFMIDKFEDYYDNAKEYWKEDQFLLRILNKAYRKVKFNKQKNESEQIISLLSDKLKELDLYLQDKKQIKMKQSKKGAKS